MVVQGITWTVVWRHYEVFHSCEGDGRQGCTCVQGLSGSRETSTNRGHVTDFRRANRARASPRFERGPDSGFKPTESPHWLVFQPRPTTTKTTPAAGRTLRTRSTRYSSSYSYFSVYIAFLRLRASCYFPVSHHSTPSTTHQPDKQR
jgi:hypothetical protein